MISVLVFLLANLINGRAFITQDENSIVMTMIIRDEAVNINSNLKLWNGIVDYFVFLVDTRTQDGSEDAIRNSLEFADVPYEIIYHQFDGFGSSRTRSLEHAWKHFPQATFVWIADPDWRPDVSSIHKKSLSGLKSLGVDAFRFTIVDRSGLTTRQCDWLLVHKQGLAMRYHLHEVLDIGEYTPAAVSWMIHEIEQPGSWHTTVGHGNSFSAQRGLFDLELLYKDLDQYGHDPHTHKYLGVTHLSYVNDMSITTTPEGVEMAHFNQKNITPEVRDHYNKGNYYCELRANPSTVYEAEFREERWDCMMQLALTASVLGYLDRAEEWYLACHAFSPNEPRCMYSLVSMMDQSRGVDKAYHYLQELLRMNIQARQGINFRSTDTCLTPQLAIPILLKYANEHSEFPVTVGFVQYLRLLVKMMGAEECRGFVGGDGDGGVIGSIVETMSVVMGIVKSESQVDESVDNLCKDSDLRLYIEKQGYNLHTCW